MKIGVPKEIKLNESRVAMTPHGAEMLVRRGHEVFVEQDCGVQSGFEDSDYTAEGAKVLKTAKEVFDTAEMIVKVKEPQPEEIAMIRSDHLVFTYFHFAADEGLTNGFMETKATAVAYETVTLEDGHLPLLIPMSEVAGRMATQEGARFLERSRGGRGILLGGVPGVPPAVVTVIGGGVVGTNAAMIAAGMGAEVYILDIDVNRLRYLDEIMPKNVVTIYSNQYNIKTLLTKTDLLIGAVLVVGAKAPHLVTRDMLSLMNKGTVIIDVAVDQGGCVETIKPTTHENPTYEIDGVIHYGVANMPGAVPFTSTIALTNVTLPYVLQLANDPLTDVLKRSRPLVAGVNMHQGKITYENVAKAFDLPFTPIEEFL